MAKIDAVDIPKLLFTEGAAPGTPAASKVHLYAKADGLLYSKDDAGVESGVSGAGGGLTWVAVSPEEVVLNTNTAVTVARTLTPAIAAVPSNAVLVTGYIQINVNAAPNNSNWFALFHANNDGEEAAIARSGIASGVTLDMPFACKVQQSSGSKVYYGVNRSAGTITYVMTVTGYWKPA